MKYLVLLLFTLSIKPCISQTSKISLVKICEQCPLFADSTIIAIRTNSDHKTDTIPGLHVYLLDYKYWYHLDEKNQIIVIVGLQDFGNYGNNGLLNKYNIDVYKLEFDHIKRLNSFKVEGIDYPNNRLSFEFAGENMFIKRGEKRYTETPILNLLNPDFKFLTTAFSQKPKNITLDSISITPSNHFPKSNMEYIMANLQYSMQGSKYWYKNRFGYRHDMFLKQLNTDLKTKAFADAHFIVFSSLYPTNLGKDYYWINISEWHFSDPKMSDLAIQKLKNLNKLGRPQIFPANWIFIQNGNKIYFIASEELSTDDENMVFIKNKVVKSLTGISTIVEIQK